VADESVFIANDDHCPQCRRRVHILRKPEPIDEGRFMVFVVIAIVVILLFLLISWKGL